MMEESRLSTRPETQIDYRTIRRMPRQRRQNGWVEKTGIKTKTWTGFWYVYEPGPDGKEKRKERSKVLGECSKITKGQAKDALKEHLQGKRPPQSNATFGQLAEWYMEINKGRWSTKWGGTVEGIFKHQILPHLGSRTAAEIGRGDVQKALNDIAADPKTQSQSLVSKCLTHIRAVFETAVDDKLLPAMPPLGRRKIKMPPTRRASERFLSLEECQRLLAVSEGRDRIILRLFMTDGFRPGELFALRLNDLEPGSLRIDQTVVDYKLKDGAKTKGSEGLVPLPPDLEAELREYIRELGVTDLLFPNTIGTAMSPDNYLDRVLKKLGVLANIDVFTDSRGRVNSRLNHQVLRRTTATHFQNHGQLKDAQGLLRHSNPMTTAKFYQKVLDERVVQGVTGWDGQLVPKKGPGREEAKDKDRRRVN